VFRVTARTLRVAAGLVRCGECSREFDAVAALTDEADAPPDVSPATDPAQFPAEYPTDDTITVEELGAGEVIEIGAANDDAMIGEAGSDAVDLDEGPAVDVEDAIDVNESSIVGLEAITLSSEDESPAPDTEALSAPPATTEEPRAGAVEPSGPTSVAEPEAVLAAAESASRDEGRPTVAAPPVDETAAAVEPASPPQPDGTEVAETSAEALEFSGSEEDLERVFVATGPPLVPVGLRYAIDTAAGVTEDAASAEAIDVTAAVEAASTVGAAVDTGTVADVDGTETGSATSIDVEATPEAPTGGTRYADLDATDEYPILVLDETDTPDAEIARQFSMETGVPDATDAAVDAGAPTRDSGHVAPIPIPESFRRDAAARSGPGEEFAAPAFALDSPRWWERTRVWVVAAVLSALTLAGQAIHYNRETLARHEVVGPWVLGTYGLLGLDPPTPTDLGAIELHQWGASTDARMPGRLRLRASLLNRAPFAQPYPVLRLTLHDRFGNRIGSRDVGARDYLPGGATGRRLFTAGQRLDAEILIVDPGSEAVGYEIDLCREDRDGVRCLDTTAPPA